MQQASAGPRPAFNDNIPAPLARGLAASMAALKDFRLPDIPARGAAARAFGTFRLALLAQQVATATTGRRSEAARRDAAGLIGDAEMIAELMAGLAADALALSATFSSQAEGFDHGR